MNDAMLSTHPVSALSVVVCAYTLDRWDDLRAAIASVLTQNRPADEVVLVVDHCQALYERASKALPAVRVVPSSGPRGLSGARNTGVAVSHGDVVAFLDDDAAAEPDWTDRLMAHYDDPRVAGVGGLVRPRWSTRRPVWFPQSSTGSSAAPTGDCPNEPLRYATSSEPTCRSAERSCLRSGDSLTLWGG